VKPGDVATCQDCGATAIATWSSRERAWAEGWPLLVSWRNGPFPRHEVAMRAPERCLWCQDRALAYPSLMGRPREGETWTVSGPLLTYEIPAIPGVKLPAPSPLTLEDVAAVVALERANDALPAPAIPARSQLSFF
jgi:hypothetical protein